MTASGRAQLADGGARQLAPDPEAGTVTLVTAPMILAPG